MAGHFSSKNKKTKTYKHRRFTRSVGQVFNYASVYLGNQLYFLGAQIERESRFFRYRTKHALRAFFTQFGKGARAVFGWLWRAVSGFFTDLFFPFAKAASLPFAYAKVSASTKEMSAEQAKQRKHDFFSEGWSKNKPRLSRFFNLFLPVAAAAGMVIVMHTMLTLDYGLQINMGNQIIGYVATEDDFNSAKQILQNKMVETEGVGYWLSDATYYISVVPASKLSSQEALADALLLASSEEISEGAGLYVGGVFLGATTEAEQLNGLIDNLLEAEKTKVSNVSNVVVRFARDVQVVDGIYLTSSIKDYGYFEQLISDSTTSTLTYTVTVGDNAVDIAGRNNLTLATLAKLNPDVDLDALEAGTELVLSEGDNLFAVRALVQKTYTEVIEYGTTALPDSRYDVGYVKVMNEGSNGVKTVTVEIEYKNGREVSRTVISEEVTKEAVDQLIVVGVHTNEGSVTSSIGTGRLVWPTGPYQMIYRGWIPGVHYGIDIAARKYTDIYAADNGVVTLSQYYFGYGECVMINHNNGMVTLYAHMVTGCRLVEVGDVVEKGQLIGLVGSTGNSTGYHLHFEVRLQGIRVDPQPWIEGEIYY